MSQPSERNTESSEEATERRSSPSVISEDSRSSTAVVSQRGLHTVRCCGREVSWLERMLRDPLRRPPRLEPRRNAETRKARRREKANRDKEWSIAALLWLNSHDVKCGVVRGFVQQKVIRINAKHII